MAKKDQPKSDGESSKASKKKPKNTPEDNRSPKEKKKDDNRSPKEKKKDDNKSDKSKHKKGKKDKDDKSMEKKKRKNKDKFDQASKQSYTDTVGSGKDDDLENEDLAKLSVADKNIIKLRLRRKLQRRKYWDRVLRITDEFERKGDVSLGEALKLKKKKGKKEKEKEKEKKDKKQKGGEAAEELIADKDFTVMDENDINVWISKAMQSLPSRSIQTTREVLKGTSYRLFKNTGHLLYAKYVLTEDAYDADAKDGDKEHLKEAASPHMQDYRKQFDYTEHLETIKSLPTSLAKKRKMYKYLNDESELFRKLKVGSHLRPFQGQVKVFQNWFEGAISDISSFLEIWYFTIQRLQYYFGSEVYLFFIWYRKLVYLQAGYLIAAALMVVLPEYLYTKCQTADPPCADCHFHVADLFFGGGWFQDGCFYYGGYHVQPLPENAGPWYTNSTYLMVIYWFLKMLVISIHLFRVRQFRQHVDVDAGKKTLFYFHEVFCSWPFYMNGIHQAKILQEQLAKKLAFLNSHVTYQGGIHATAGVVQHKWAWLLRKFAHGSRGIRLYNLTVNVISLIIGVLSGGLFFLTLSFFYKQVSFKRIEHSIAAILPGMYLGFLNNFLSSWVVYISDMSLWQKRLARNFTVLLRHEHFFYKPNKQFFLCAVESLYNKLTLIYAIHLLTFAFFFITELRIEQGTVCLENSMGILLYCIFLWEFFFTVITWALKDFLINFVCWKITSGYYEQPEPVMDSHFVSMVFMHSLLSIGVPFAPLLPICTLMYFVAQFYLKKTILLTVFGHPRVAIQMADYELPYFITYFIFFVLSTFASLHIYWTGHPSEHCGPFATLYANWTNEDHRLTYNEIIANQLKGIVSSIYIIIFNPAIGFTILLLAIGGIYIVRHWTAAYSQTLETYNDLFFLERQDRNYLLRAIYDFSEGNKGGKTTDFSLVLDRSNIYKTKVRFIATMIVGGRRYVLSKRYRDTMAAREQLFNQHVNPDTGEKEPSDEEVPEKKDETDLVTTPADAEDEEKKKKPPKPMTPDQIQKLKAKLNAQGVVPAPETINARRQSLAQKFLMHTGAIKLAHTAARKEKRRRWAEDKARSHKKSATSIKSAL